MKNTMKQRTKSPLTISMEWKKFGSGLNEPKTSHGVFLDGDEFLIVGGNRLAWWKEEFITERCIPNEDFMICDSFDPELRSYSFHPQMMRVPNDYCLYDTY